MAARNNPASEFWLNECKVVPNQNLIVCGTEEVSINPRSMAVLLVLVERQGEYLGAQALFDQVWPANHISDNSVYKAINELRTAFGDIAEDPQFIETKSRRGYRLITAPKQSARNRRMLRNPWIYAALGLGVIAIAGFNGFDTLSIESNEPADVSKSCPVDEDSGINLCTDPSPTSIAVLQLVSPGNDSQENLYAQTLSEALISSLSQVQHITVASRHDSRKESLVDSTTGDVGKRLGVDHVLVGDLRIVGDHIELDIQLVAVESGMELYSDRIFWETSESGAVPEEILNKLLTTLKVHLNDVVRTVMLRTGTNNAEAFLEMQRSRRTLNAVTAPDLTLAAKYARNALALDPEYEGAYRCLLIVYERMAQYVSVEQNEIIRREVERIVFDLEQHLPGSEVHGLAKFIAASLDNDRLKMVSSLVQAIRANPEQADVEDRAVRPYPTFGGELLLAGLIEAGDAYMRRYFEVIDIPYKPPLAVVLRNGGIDAVMDRRKELIARDIEVIRSLSGLSTDYARKGDFEQARESLSRLDQEDKAGIWAHGVRHIVMALEGRLTNGSAAHTEFTANPITVDIQRGTIAFINGELSDGIRYWNNLGPAERRFLNMNLLFMEHYLSDTILQDEAYIALKDRLGVGPQWRNYLKAKVIELEPFTGIGLSGEMATSVAYID